MVNWRRAWCPGGTWFFTVNLLERRDNWLLVDKIDLLRRTVTKVKKAHPFTIHAWVVLPDHLHCILSLPEGDSDFPRARSRTIFERTIGFDRRPGL